MPHKVHVLLLTDNVIKIPAHLFQTMKSSVKSHPDINIEVTAYIKAYYMGKKHQVDIVVPLNFNLCRYCLKISNCQCVRSYKTEPFVY